MARPCPIRGDAVNYFRLPLALRLFEAAVSERLENWGELPITEPLETRLDEVFEYEDVTPSLLADKIQAHYDGFTQAELFEQLAYRGIKP